MGDYMGIYTVMCPCGKSAWILDPSALLTEHGWNLGEQCPWSDRPADAQDPTHATPFQESPHRVRPHDPHHKTPPDWFEIARRRGNLWSQGRAGGIEDGPSIEHGAWAEQGRRLNPFGRTVRSMPLCDEPTRVSPLSSPPQAA